MNCKNFQDQILKNDFQETPLSSVAMEHLKVCPGCKQIFSLNEGLNNKIRSAFETQAPPKTLYESVEMALDQAGSIQPPKKSK